MSIEGMKFCDLCGGAIIRGEFTAVKIEEDVPYATLKSFYPDLEVLKP